MADKLWEFGLLLTVLVLTTCIIIDDVYVESKYCLFPPYSHMLKTV